MRLGTVRELSISALLAAYILFSILWMIPDCPIKKAWMEPVRLFWLYWGLDQNWSLFSPRIRDTNFHTIILVRMKDGMITMWEPPRMDKLSLVERFRREKFRKWSVDSLPWPDYKNYWPDLARFVGRKLYKADNPPEQFSLVLFWAQYPAADKNPLPAAELPDPYNQWTVFDYQYTEADFK